MTPKTPCWIGLRALALFASTIVTLACPGEAPPPGFESVVLAAPRHPGDACPDLAGTFDLAGHPLAGEIFGAAPPDGHGLPVRLSFVAESGPPSAWWHVPRPALLEFARELAARDPDRYFAWWSLARRESLPDDLLYDPAKWRSALAELGPPLPTSAGFSGDRCEAGWLLVAARDVDAEHEEEIWLARAAEGGLLVRRTVYEVFHYTVWAPASQRLRLPPGETTWARIEPVPREGPVPIAAQDLPTAHDPATRSVRCPARPDRVVDFSQRLMAGLPAGTEIVRLDVDRATQPDPTTGCPALVVELDVSAPTEEGLAAGERLVRGDPEVRELEARPAEASARRPSMRSSARPTRTLRAVLVERG